MGKSAKFFKRPTRKEKAVLSLTKGEPSLFDAAHSSSSSKDTNNDDEDSAAASGNSRRKSKKDGLSATAHPTIAKKSSTSIGGPAGAAHPSKSSLAYKMQLHGGVKQAIKDLSELDNEEEVESEDEDMMDEEGSKKKKSAGKKDMDKSKPRPDYVELMYGKQGGNKRKTFMPKPKPALIK